MAEDGEPRWSRTTVVAVAAGCGAVVVAALVLEATDGVERGPGGVEAPYRCLYDVDITAVFPLLVSGTGRSMLVDDGGVVRRIHLRFGFPYHVEPLDICR